MDLTFFATTAPFRAWLAAHHATERELVVGFWRVGSGQPSMTWPGSVDEAICFGWIDGVRRSRDAESYTIRFTPRKPRSIWSAVNVAKAQALIASGRMEPAGHAAYALRSADRTGIYLHEQDVDPALTPAEQALLDANPAAAAYLAARTPGYRRQATWWVINVKRSETRARRLAELIRASTAGSDVR